MSKWKKWAAIVGAAGVLAAGAYMGPAGSEAARRLWDGVIAVLAPVD
jgi:hypothetical protein